VTEYLVPCPVCGGKVEGVERAQPADFVEWAAMTEDARDAMPWLILPCRHETAERPVEKVTRFWMRSDEPDGEQVLAAVEALASEWDLTEFPDERTAMIMRADLRRLIESIQQ
jgi:hypothetical protein